MFKMVQTGMGVAILMVGLISQANGYDDQASQSCRGDSQAKGLRTNKVNKLTVIAGGESSSNRHGRLLVLD